MIDDKVAFLVLNYNTYKKTKRCVQSCVAQTGIDKRVFIVDNNSTDDSLKRLKEEFGTEVEFIEFKDNYGYAGGNNRAVLYVESKGFKYSFILNSDTELIGSNLCNRLLQAFSENERCAVVAPRIFNVTKNGLVLNENQSVYLKLLIKTRIVPFKYMELERFVAIPEAQGSALLVDNRIFKQVGGFPEEYFMYNEESTFAKKLLWEGYYIFWDKSKDNFVKHHHDKSDNVACWRVYLMGRNKALEYYKYKYKSPILWPIIFRLFLLNCRRNNIFNSYHSYKKGVLIGKHLIKTKANEGIIIEDARNAIKAF